jgi:hypothetical protein
MQAPGKMPVAAAHAHAPIDHHMGTDLAARTDLTTSGTDHRIGADLARPLASSARGIDHDGGGVNGGWPWQLSSSPSIDQGEHQLSRAHQLAVHRGTRH